MKLGWFFLFELLDSYQKMICNISVKVARQHDFLAGKKSNTKQNTWSQWCSRNCTTSWCCHWYLPNNIQLVITQNSWLLDPLRSVVIGAFLNLHVDYLFIFSLLFFLFQKKLFENLSNAMIFIGKSYCQFFFALSNKWEIRKPMLRTCINICSGDVFK